MQSLNSDQLRERLHKNTLKMDRLTKKTRIHLEKTRVTHAA